MASTQNSGEKMHCDRESFLCELLDNGGKSLGDEGMAFQKKSFCFSRE